MENAENNLIDRKMLVRRHNPILYAAHLESPLTVGNGEFAFTADVTGLQSLYDAYDVFPLCMMSNWGWHTQPEADGKRYTLDDVIPTRYDIGGRVFSYASEKHPDNEAAYDWLRHNPHRLNLARVSLLWDAQSISMDDIKSVRQELDLYSGVLTSEFLLHGTFYRIHTVCAQSADVLGFSIEAFSNGESFTPSPISERLSICISFPYGSHHKNASDWESPDCHATEVSELLPTLDPCHRRQQAICHGFSLVGASGAPHTRKTAPNRLPPAYTVGFTRTLDDDRYFVQLCFSENVKTLLHQTGKHSFEFRASSFTLAFSPSFDISGSWDFESVLRDSAKGWDNFWQTCGAVDFSRCKDSRAMELERRVVLSQYLTAAQCSGSLPPQETGLSCNSWYGKFHLEMHILHAGWFPLWGHSRLLERSLPWYRSILGKARENAARNGFTGARWPKMVGPDGIDSPSWIATLLIWQQPHLLYMLELISSTKPDDGRYAFIQEHWDLVRETAEFMCSFSRFDDKNDCYNLPPPLIPAQEEHKPEVSQNPAFELSYWRFGLSIAGAMARELGEAEFYRKWSDVAGKMAVPQIYDDLYHAHQNCTDTFTSFNRDHPSMLYAYGFIPCDVIDTQITSDTADVVQKCWDKSSMWGWDFALIAMTYTRLGRPEDAVEALLADTAKNCYTISGNNFQRGRDDLPLYLPGNGSLLLALAMMLAGYGEKKGTAGFPKNGMWEGIEVEGVLPLPY